MLLQNTLDLSTFEIVRFRIWNQTSNPDDYGVGTKYFNTNSGHEGYNRENIYTATGWRKTAYLDDIDKINEKLDLIFGEEIDTDTIIDSWKEVQDFLSGIEDTKNLMTMLDGKLDKKGGTITGNLSVNQRLIVKSIFQFDQYNDGKEYLLGMTDNNGILRWYNGSSWNTLLHAGNFNDIARPLASGTWGIDISGKADKARVLSSTKSYEQLGSIVNIAAAGVTFMSTINPTAEGMFPANDYANSILTINRHHQSSNSAQLGFTGTNKIYFRGISGDGTPTDWKTIAFTDQVLLLDGSNIMARNAYIAWNSGADGNDISDWGAVAGNGLRIISSSAENTGAPTPYATALHVRGRYYFKLASRGGSVDELYYQNSNHDWKTIAFTDSTVAAAYKLKNPSTNGDVVTITEEGRVSVGSNYSVAGDKLYSRGRVNILSLCTNPTLGNAPVNGLILTNNTSQLGMSQWVSDGSGQGNIQAGRFDGTATAYALNLNPLGGAVNVGGNLAPNANNNLLLGTSSYRWSDVYSVGGNFSGRVLIGGAADNENYKLITNGAIKIGRSNDASTYLGITVSDILTTFDANDGGDKYMRYSFQSHGTELLRLDGKEGGTSYFRTLVRFDKEATFNGGALIPTGQTLTIGSVTFKETATGEIEVDGNLHTTGTLASGGKAQEGENTTGNAMVYQYDLASGESVYTVDNVKGSTNVIVQIFEWNSNTSSWDMILTDVSVKADEITVTFGRTTTVNHMVTVC